MKLASHNTMSYLSPQWWVKPFGWIAKCQAKTIEEQYDNGVRMFDLRVAFDNKDNIFFAHGMASYKVIDVREILEKINKWSKEYFKSSGEYIVCRLINERNNNEVKFRDFAYECFEKYQYIQFCGIRNKNNKGNFEYWPIRSENGYGCGDSGEIHRVTKNSAFHSTPKSDFRIYFIDKYSSDNCSKHEHCTGIWLDDLCPRIYAKLFNKRWREKYKEFDGFLMQDFVGKF